MAMKRYSIFPKALEHHHQIVMCHIRTLIWVGSYPSTQKQPVYFTARADWAKYDGEVVNIEVIQNSRGETLRDALYFHIEQWHWQNTLLVDSLFLLVEIRKGWSDSDSDFPTREKTLKEVRQSTSQLHDLSLFQGLSLFQTFLWCCKSSPDQRRLL